VAYPVTQGQYLDRVSGSGYGAASGFLGAFSRLSACTVVALSHAGGGFGEKRGDASIEWADRGQTGADDGHPDVYGGPKFRFGVFGHTAAGDIGVDDADDACNYDAGWRSEKMIGWGI
jgi:hypothetical protein